ncbi:hypothetical protein Leryth_002365 [Lithospermum erythrorhizon]|nr:hypothetical protein Leryth_002365 [Lithospermum erythrorhizon]
MCSYGGRIQPRLSNATQLTYVGGDTKLLTVDRKVKFSDMIIKLTSLCNIVMEFCVKYQLPGDDLDALVSILDDDDMEHMMFEYDNLKKDPTRAARIRLFLFGVGNGPVNSPGSDFPLNPDYLFGFDKAFDPGYVDPRSKALETPGTIVPGVSGFNDVAINNNDSHFGHGAREGHVTYRVPVNGGWGQGGPRMVNWAASVQDQKMGV